VSNRPRGGLLQAHRRHVADNREEAAQFGRRKQKPSAKTLEQAIGCWTVNPDGFRTRIQLISQSARVCNLFTQQNKPPAELLSELQFMRRRIASLTEVVDSAIVRCEAIISTGEVAS
jgi:hypothetical protein